jgi:oligoribonuclease
MSAIETYDPTTSRLIWIDLEMTGLDIFHDEICEMAIIPTDFNLDPLDEGIDMVIKPSQAALDHMNDFVRKMHTDNGLLEKMKTGISYQEAERRAIDYILPFLPTDGSKAHLAGNTVGSDKKFLDHFMPTLMSHLHYRSIDVSSLKELCRRWYPAVIANAPAKHGADRSLGDIIESIDELRYYRQTMFLPSPGPDDAQAKKIAEQVEKTSLLRRYESNGRILADPSTAAKRDY